VNLNNNIRIKNWGTFFSSQHFGDRGLCSSFEMKIRKNDKQKLVSA
jgi:hypothetical protein